MQPMLDWIITECDVGSDGVLQQHELQHCGRLIQPGIIFYTLFQHKQLVPKIYGSCGDMIGFEYASPKLLHASRFDKRPWTLRVKLALAVLDYIQELDHTSLGTLYLCDLHWKNLGVIMNASGGLRIISIDNDKTYFGEALERRLNVSRQCKIDRDCRVEGCSVECNQHTRTCARHLSSNNLQVCQ